MNFQGHIVCYADDTAIVFKGKSWKEVHNNAETNMQKFQCWLNNNLLSMNMDKTKYMKFSLISSEHPTEMKFHIHKNTCNNKNGNNCSCPSIEKAETVRYLGILIDHHLRWDKQTSNVAERLRLLLYKFYRLRDILSRKNLLIVYKALAESIIQYCIMVWGGTFNNSLRHLQTTQNSIIKIIFRKERLFPTDQLYLETGILNVRSIYSYQCLKWMFSNMNKYNIITVKTTRSTENRNVGIPLFRKAHTQRFLFYFGPKLYNLLPAHLRNVSNFRQIKTDLKSYIISNPSIFDIF